MRYPDDYEPRSFYMIVTCKKDIGNYCWKKGITYIIEVKDCNHVVPNSLTAQALNIKEYIGCRFDSLESFLDTFDF